MKIVIPGGTGQVGGILSRTLIARGHDVVVLGSRHHPTKAVTGTVSEVVTAHQRNDNMLELRPTCENCNKPLPPDSTEARICSFECTFCASCVDDVLTNVCPNCGGGFCPRPIRPTTAWNGAAHLGKRPASTQITHRPVNAAAHALFAASIRQLPPEQR